MGTVPSSSLTSKPAERTLVWLLLIPVLAANVFCGVRLLRLVNQQSTIKADYAEVNSIQNGLLSVEVWKGHLQSIAARKLSNYKLTSDQEDIVKGAVEKAVTALIAELD